MAADALHFFNISASPARDAWQVVAAFAPHLRIAHQLSGRVRLKLDAAALDEKTLREIGAERLSETLGAIRGVRGVQINLLARSCVVEYDSAAIPDAAWSDLLTGRRTPAAEALIAVLREAHAGAAP